MLLVQYMKTNFKAAMEYRAAFLLQVFGMILNNASFIVFWILLLQRIGGSLNGYGFKEIMFLWSLVSAAFGMCVLIFGNALSLSQIIMKGELDVYLLQPTNLLANVLGSRMRVSGLGDLIYGIVLFAATQQAGFAAWGLFILFVLLAMLVFTAVMVIYHSLTFYLGNAEHTAHLAFEGLISFSIYPGSVFKGPIRWLLHSLLPVAWTAWVPAEIVSGLFSETMDWSSLFLLAGVDLLFVTFAVFFFYRGVRRYESGNRIGARM